MATISLTIRRSQPNKDGSYNIKVAIAQNGQTVYIPTRFNVEDASQFENGRVKRRPDARALNTKLSALLSEYEEISDSAPSFYSAKQVREYIEHELNKSDYFCDFAKGYINRLYELGRKSYAQNMEYTLRYVLNKFGDALRLSDFRANLLVDFETYLRENGQSNTTINIRMSHLKALLNAAVNEGVVEYKIFPFRSYKMPAKNVRDICISKSELVKLREAEFDGVSAKRLTVARDLFLLSFYCAGINLTDLMGATLTGDILTFVRKKTAEKKTGTDKEVSITIQPEAREIINKYVNEQGKLNMGYQYKDYEQFRSFVTKSLNRIGELLGFEKKLMFYSARKTFVQFGTELGIPLYILEYAIGQTIKEANNRPIFNYLKIMRQQADLAIRTIIDYSFEPETEDDATPLPEWARRRH